MNQPVPEHIRQLETTDHYATILLAIVCAVAALVALAFTKTVAAVFAVVATLLVLRFVIWRPMRATRLR
jgi:uncharacterized membrane protein